MDNIFNYIKDNISWIFDGIGVTVITILLGFFIKDKIEKRNKNKSRDNNIQKNFDGDNKENQELINCPNAQPIFIQGDYNNGITSIEARQIALDVFKANSIELSKTANDIALGRAEELTNNFLDNLFNNNPSIIEKLKEPSMQSTFVTAQIQYAKTGDEVTKEILVTALNERVNAPEQTLKQRILDEAISTMSKITIDQINFLTLWFVILYGSKALGNKEELKQYIEENIIKFYSNNFNSNQFFSYLYYTNCVKVLPEGSTLKPIEEIFGNFYSGIFSNGFSEEEFKTKVDNEIEKYNELIIKCLNDDSKLQFNALNEKVLKGRIKELGLSNKEIEILKLAKEKQKNPQTVKKELIQICPDIKEILELWKNESDVKAIELTPVGLVIAILNYNRVTGNNIDINTFI